MRLYGSKTYSEDCEVIDHISANLETIQNITDDIYFTDDECPCIYGLPENAGDFDVCWYPMNGSVDGDDVYNIDGKYYKPNGTFPEEYYKTVVTKEINWDKLSTVPFGYIKTTYKNGEKVKTEFIKD